MKQDYRQSAEYNHFFENQHWVVEKINGNFILIKHLPLVGSVIKILHRFKKKVVVYSSRKTLSWELKMGCDEYRFLEGLKRYLTRK